MGLYRTRRLVASATLIAAIGSAFGVFTVGCAGRTDRSFAQQGRATASMHLSFAHTKPRRGHFTRTHARDGGVVSTFTAPDPGATDTVLGQLLTNITRVDATHDQDTFCPAGMASIDGLYCIDRFEASLVETLADGEERRWAPFTATEDHAVRAVSEAGVFPQAYISANQAQVACERSGKRLCKPAEWRKACMGPAKTTYSYGDANEPRRCNDSGKSPLAAIYGSEVVTSSWEKMNNPSLNQLPGSIAKAGAFAGCANDFGVHDMVGNLHEWVDDSEGTFLGGYYLDTHQNGEGCQYATVAHAAWYHDYSTGFRCCADRQFEVAELDVELDSD